MACLIEKLLQVCWDMWEHRNSHLHSRDTGARCVALRADIIRLKSLSRSSLGLPDRKLLDARTSTLLRLHPDTQAAWIARVEAAKDRYARRRLVNQASLAAQRRLMHRHFSVSTLPFSLD